MLMPTPEKFNSAPGASVSIVLPMFRCKRRTASTPFMLGWTACPTALGSGKWPRKCDIESAFLPTRLTRHRCRFPSRTSKQSRYVGGDLEDSVSGTARCAWPREPGTTHELNRCLHVIRRVRTSPPFSPHPKKDDKKNGRFPRGNRPFFFDYGSPLLLRCHSPSMLFRQLTLRRPSTSSTHVP
jgi:hypothetical protein